MRLHSLRTLFAITLFLGGGAKVLQAQATLDWVSSKRARGNCVLTDANGSIYVSTGVDLVKFDLQGNVLWSQMLDPLGGYRSVATWMTFDPNGDIILTGGSSASSNEFMTMKYDTAGNKLWQTSTSGGRYAFRVATDSAGNSYVVGTTPSSLSDYATAKYDPNGKELWFRVFAPATINRAFHMAVSPAGEVAVTGEADLSDYDMVTVLYETDGSVRWARSYTSTIGGGGQDHGSSVAFGPQGAVYVGGAIETAPFDWDFALVKYDAAGNELWARTYASPNGGFDSIDRLAVDSQGNVVATGYMDSDVGTIKVDLQGNQIWMDRFDGGGIGSEEFVSEMILSSDDSIYVTGESGQEILTLKYDANGDLRWDTTYDIPTTFSEQGYSIALDSAKGIVVAVTFPALALRYVEDQTWNGLGQGLRGSAGVPVLTGQGSLSAGQPVSLTMTQCAASAPYLMIIGQSQLNLPLFGGTLVPSPDFIVTGLKTDAAGRTMLSATWPAGIPAGSTFVFQSWIMDGSGPQGFSASNGLQGTTK